MRYAMCLVSLLLLFGCETGKELRLRERQIDARNRAISRIERHNDILLSKLVLLSGGRNLEASGAVLDDADMERAERIVEAFSTAVDNVDTEENYEFIGEVIMKMDPLDSRRKVRLLMRIAKHYTPTDYVYSGEAGRKLVTYGKTLFPEADESKLLFSDDSPLLRMFD